MTCGYAWSQGIPVALPLLPVVSGLAGSLVVGVAAGIGVLCSRDLSYSLAQLDGYYTYPTTTTTCPRRCASGICASGFFAWGAAAGGRHHVVGDAACSSPECSEAHAAEARHGFIRRRHRKPT